MDISQFLDYCNAKKGVEESFPFDEHTLVLKVMGKIFSITGLNSDEFKINLKCDPDRALELRERHHQIIPGYHMNKKHWNTVSCEDGLPNSLIKELIDHSYDLVVSGLKKSDRAILEKL